MVIILNGYTLNTTNFKITGMDIKSTKNIDVQDLESRNGASINRFAYYGNLGIVISGKTDIDYLQRSQLESILAYGDVRIQIDDVYYVGQLELFNIVDSSDGSDFNDFSLKFICDKPYAYDTVVYSDSFVLTSQIPTVMYTNTNILFPLDNVNYWLNNTAVGLPTIKLAGYLPVALANDTTGQGTLTVTTVTGFDLNRNSVGAIFPTATHVPRMYIYADSVTSNLINRNNIDIYYSADSGVTWILSENDYSFSIKSGSKIGKPGKFIELDYVNVVGNAVKVNYRGTSTTATIKFNTTATKSFDRLIIPEFYSSVEFTDASTATTQYYYMNPAYGTITKNNQVSVGSTKGNMFKLYPLKTYYAIYGTGSLSVTMNIKFNTFNIYKVV